MLRNYLLFVIGALTALTHPLQAADTEVEEASEQFVKVDALFVDFPSEEIESITRSSAQPVPGTTEILSLWRSGKGTLLHAMNLSTRSGINAQVEAVREFIYPTEFESPPIQTTNTVDSAPQLPIPSSFETREVGAIINVTPTVRGDGRIIDLTMFLELVAEPEWQKVSVTGSDKNKQILEIEVSQPIFHSRNLTTSITVYDQSTHVLGGMKNPEGDGITYIFLTATLTDSSGQPLWSPEKKKTE